MNLRTITAVFGMALIMAVLAGPAGAATDYNLQNDWNNISNPNGPWEYLQGSNVLPPQPVGPIGAPSFAPGYVWGNFPALLVY